MSRQTRSVKSKVKSQAPTVGAVERAAATSEVGMGPSTRHLGQNGRVRSFELGYRIAFITGW